VKYELGFYIPEDAILHSHGGENIKSYTADNSLAEVQNQTDLNGVRSWVSEDRRCSSNAACFCFNTTASVLLITGT
jgi:hypothetical protein